MTEEEQNEVDKIKRLLASLPSDELRLTAIDGMCRYCGCNLNERGVCYCMRDE
jgi:hypothetical protein